MIAGVVWISGNLAPKANFTVGAKLPAFSAPLTDGSQFSSSVPSKQITVLNFWASYCEPCRAEAPMLSSAQARDVRVIGLSVEAFPAAEVSTRARALGMRYPVGIADRALMSRFQVHTLPTTYVIASDGVIVLSRVGAISESELGAALESARRRES
ncbi:MAG TPA: TlpA disulfide reductase family protein, partial [Polyangiales bacterium]